MDQHNNAPATVADFKELATFVGEKFEGVDKKFEQVDKRFEQVDKRFEQVDKRFDKIETRLDGLDKKFDIALTGIDKILQFSEAQKEENIVGAHQIRRHTDTLDDHEKRLKVLELQTQK